MSNFKYFGLKKFYDLPIYKNKNKSYKTAHFIKTKIS